MAEKNPWDADIDHVHDELVEAHAMADGASFAIAAVALAAIDKGAIERDALIDIIESLRQILHLDYEMKAGSAESAEIALNSLAALISGPAWKRGEVLATLRQAETAALVASLLRAKRR